MEERRSFDGIYEEAMARLWYFSASTRLSLALIGICIAVMLVASSLPQVPVQVREDAGAYARWLAGVRNRYGNTATEILRSVGLLDIGGSFGFRLLLAALAFNILIGSADKIVSTKRLYGEGFRWPKVMHFLPHLGVLFILLGLLVTDRWGWQEVGVPLSEGQRHSVGHGTGITLLAERMEVVSAPDGNLASWRSELLLLHRDQNAHQGIIRPAFPLYYRGILFSQPAVGPSIEVMAEDENGQPVALQIFPAQLFEQGKSSMFFRDHGDEGYIAVPSRNISLRIVYYTSLPQREKKDGPVLYVQAYQGGKRTPIWDTYLEDEVTWVFEGTTYRLRRGYYAILQISFMPGLPAIAVGALLITLRAMAQYLAPGRHS